MSFQIHIGHYRLNRTLGTGSFSKVKLAEHEITQKKVAIKILNKRKIRNMKMSEKVKREIKVLKLFKHPNIISLYEFIDTPSDIFVVMDYVAGGELFDIISRRGKLSEPEARHYFRQIIAGVEYCHINKVAHRDLKPENVLIDSDNNVKLVDFGLCNIVKDGSFLKTSCGSPNYAAPEVISGAPYCGPEVDVWSCGIILFAMLAGNLPFDDQQIATLFAKIKTANYRMPVRISEKSQDLINKMLQPYGPARISIQDIKTHDWFTEGLPGGGPEYFPLDIELAVNKKRNIDESVLALMFQVGAPALTRQKFPDVFDPKHADEYRALIKHCENDNCVVVYDMLLDQRRSERMAEEQKKPDSEWDRVSEPAERAVWVFQEGKRPASEDAANREKLALFHKKNKARVHMYNIVDEKVRSESRAGSGGAGAGVGVGVGLADPLLPGLKGSEALDVKGLARSKGEQLETQPAEEVERMTITYGYMVSSHHSPYEILALCCENMAQLSLEWKVVSKEYKLKVRSCTDQLQPDANIDEFMKHYFLKFTLQVQRISKLSNDHIIDLHLIKGRPMMFADFCSTLFSKLSQSLYAPPLVPA